MYLTSPYGIPIHGFLTTYTLTCTFTYELLIQGSSLVARRCPPTFLWHCLSFLISVPWLSYNTASHFSSVSPDISTALGYLRRACQGNHTGNRTLEIHTGNHMEPHLEPHGTTHGTTIFKHECTKKVAVSAPTILLRGCGLLARTSFTSPPTMPIYPSTLITSHFIDACLTQGCFGYLHCDLVLLFVSCHPPPC